MNARHALFDLVGVLARKRYQLAEQHFAKIGLNHTEARLLRLTKAQGGEAFQEALSQMIFIDRSNVGRALKKLEAEGFVSRVKHSVDRRANLVKITSKGTAAVKEIERLGRSMADDFFGDLTDAQAQEIADQLTAAMKLAAKVES